MKVVVYVEGGGHQRKTLDDCRRGFGQLFEKIVPIGHRPKVVACGDRGSTFSDFRRALRQTTEAFLILLVDSEDPVAEGNSRWSHLRMRVGDEWERPLDATDEQAQLMVQCMESWFLADLEALSTYYGQGFLVNSLPGQTNIEKIPKRDVEQALEHATRPTQKGSYHKTRHGFELLALIEPAKLRGASDHARMLFEALEARANV